MPPLRLLLVDDHATFRATATAYFSGRADLLVAAEADSGESALALASRERFDLVLLDLGLIGISGFDTARRLRRLNPAPRILVVTLHEGAEYRRLAQAAGADGFVNKAEFAGGVLAQIHRLFPHLVPTAAPAGGGPAALPVEGTAPT